ncbi:MFS transporter [Streptomyces sp. NPDC004609]|uniref:MFS transporter n=1 Tax=Streptomyces sp. NPDC004609 TaxID=3364704 RepID=UPI003682E90A
MSEAITSTAKRPAPSGWSSKPLAVLLPLLFIEFFSGVLQIYFVPLYPWLSREFGVDAGSLAWALTVFTIAGALGTPLLAKLGDLYGHRRILRVNLGLVSLGSLVIAIAPNFGFLLVGRSLQGLFPALLPLMFGLIRSRFDADVTRRAVAYLTSCLLFGGLIGAIATSQLVKAAGGPEWVLWIPVVGTVIGSGLLWLGHEHTVRDPEARVDWAGAALLGLGLVCLLLGLNQGPSWGWTSAGILAPLGLGLLLLVTWVIVELRVDQPLADLRFLFRPRLVPVYVVGGGVYFAIEGGQMANSMFMGLELGLSASEIGLMLIPKIGLAVLTAALSAPLSRWIGFSWIMVIGSACVAVNATGLIFFRDSIAEYLVFAMLGTAGLGFVAGSARAVMVGELRRHEMSTGQGVYQLSIVIGAAIGSAVLGAIFAANLHGTIPTGSAYTLVWIAQSAMALIALIAALTHVSRTARGRTGGVPEGTA